MSSRRFAKLVGEMERSYDYVVFDMPPVGTFVDAAILSTLVDGTIIVVKPGSTKRDELLGAYEQLQKADAHVIGACATFCEGRAASTYAYYTEDGKRAKPTAGRRSITRFPSPSIPPHAAVGAQVFAGRRQARRASEGSRRPVRGGSNNPRLK